MIKCRAVHCSNDPKMEIECVRTRDTIDPLESSLRSLVAQERGAFVISYVACLQDSSFAQSGEKCSINRIKCQRIKIMAIRVTCLIDWETIINREKYESVVLCTK